jgi:hypothetical protein
MSLQNKNIIVANSDVIASYKLPNQVNKLTVEARKVLILAIFPVLLSGIIVTSPANASESLAEVAQNTANCREVRNPEVRLACFDAAIKRLVDLLNGAEGLADPDTPEPDSLEAKLLPATADDELPTWAAGPQYTEEDRAQDSTSFEATIVRITRNSRGRHRFYTEDGAIWEQTVAEFRQKMTGSPAITFDVSSRSYRVSRIE